MRREVVNVLIAAQEKSKKDDADKSQPKLRLSTAGAAVVVHARWIHVGGLNQWLTKQALVCKSVETDECTLYSLSACYTASVAYLVC